MQATKFLTLSQRLRLVNFPIKFTCAPVTRYYNVRTCFAKRFQLKPSSFSHPFCSSNLESPLLISPFVENRGLSSSSTKSDKGDIEENEEPIEKLSLFKKYKKMLKEYWYVLLPVHLVTSAVWFGGFYYAATCGLDIIPFLEYLNLPDALISPLRNSSLGHIAVASALYKLATPGRYMVTVGGSTFAVNILKKRGLIKPIPTKAELKTLIKKKLKKDGVSEDN